MKSLMAHLGNPQDSYKVVHVAGTSGKTSTAYYIAALLTAAGCKTGLTVSPHVDELNERVQLNGHPLPEAEFCAALQRFAVLIEAAPVRPSWFECMAAFAYWYMAEAAVDYAVVEVGVGGLLDGTNVISRTDKVCVITDIGLDHRDLLGDSLAEITVQKLGIVLPGNLVFMHSQPEEVMAVAKQTAAERQASLHVIQDVPNPGGLPAYQWRNWQLAQAVYDSIRLRDGMAELSSAQLARTREIQVPGRMDIRKYRGKTVVLDGAHNAQKMAAFLGSVQQLYPGVRPAVLLAVREGKDYGELVPLLAAATDQVICTSFTANQDFPIASVPAEELGRAFTRAGMTNVQTIPDYKAALSTLLATDHGTVIVTGSLYLAGHIRSLLT